MRRRFLCFILDLSLFKPLKSASHGALHRLLALGLGLAGLFLPFLGGQPRLIAGQAGEHNLREACRQQVAGRYLNFYDQKEKSSQLLTRLALNDQALAAALGPAEKALSQLETTIAVASFDSQLNAQRGNLAAKVAMLKDALASNATQRKQAEQQMVKAAKGLEDFAGRLQPIFRIETIVGKGAGYKFQVLYQTACPPYRFSCPLSRKDAKALRAMFTPSSSLPPVCGKYADFLQG